jgi:phosphatidylglycerophosphate synthase
MSGFRRRWAALRPGISVGEHTNNLDFWGIVFGRPLAFLLLVLVGDVPLVTPNGLTWFSFLLLIVGAALVAFGGPEWWVLAAVLVNLNVAVDCADGQLARYRKVSSPYGSYLDKVTDYLSFLLLFAALAHVSVQLTGETYYIYIAMLGLFSQVMVGYVKWLSIADRLGKGKALLDLPLKPWPRGPGFWLRLFLKLFEFREPDIYLWVGIALVIGKPHWALWLVLVTQPPVMLGAVFVRGWQMVRP